MKARFRIQFLMFAIIANSIACKKLIDVPAPVTSVNSANVYTGDATAAAVLTGIYTNLSEADAGWYGIPSLFVYTSLSADELTLYDINNTRFNPYYLNGLSNSNLGGVDFWLAAYGVIYDANAAIEGLNSSSGLTGAVKKQLLGEAYFIRAFCYFYLVNLYGDIPLALTTNYSKNAVLSRTAKAQVWQQVIADLHSAQGLLSPNYLDATLLKATQERTRPTLWAATALLARTYLYAGNWSGADSAASAVIGSSNFSLVPLNPQGKVFAKNSAEAIWQLQPVGYGGVANTGEGLLFVLPSTGPTVSGNYPVYLANLLLNSFESGDQRRINWVDSVKVGATLYYFPYKYQAGRLNTTVSEYATVLRLGEQYLIRAEARAQEGLISGANSAGSDLNAIRARAGLPGTTATTQATIMTAILHERQVELFTEWGHRWLDLKRTGTIDAIMGSPGNACSIKGGSWNSNWQWYPIAFTELTANPNLQQNAGY